MSYVVWDNDYTPTTLSGEFFNYYLTNIGGRATKAIQKITEQEFEAIKAGNVPWTPRTGLAQEGLKYRIERVENDYIITVYYDPDIVKAWRPKAPSSDSDGYFRYGYSLEKLHEGRFQILTPLIQRIFVRSMTELQRLFASPRRRDKDR